MSIYRVQMCVEGTEDDAKELRKSLAQTICDEYELESVFAVSVNLDEDTPTGCDG